MNCGERACVVAGARRESAQASCIRPANRKVNHRHQAVVMQRPLVESSCLSGGKYPTVDGTTGWQTIDVSETG